MKFWQNIGKGAQVDISGGEEGDEQRPMVHVHHRVFVVVGCDALVFTQLQLTCLQSKFAREKERERE